jgi:hypothetical protein
LGFDIRNRKEYEVPQNSIYLEVLLGSKEGFFGRKLIAPKQNKGAVRVQRDFSLTPISLSLATYKADLSATLMQFISTH